MKNLNYIIPQRPNSLRYFDFETKVASLAYFHYDSTRTRIPKDLSRIFSGTKAPNNN